MVVGKICLRLLTIKTENIIEAARDDTVRLGKSARMRDMALIKITEATKDQVGLSIGERFMKISVVIDKVAEVSLVVLIYEYLLSLSRPILIST